MSLATDRLALAYLAKHEVQPPEPLTQTFIGKTPTQIVAALDPALDFRSLRNEIAVLERAHNAQLMTRNDASWPTSLARLGEREPFALWVRGDLTLLQRERIVTIDGARAATAYGEQIARDLGADLAQQGCIVVNGGAYGIAGASLRGAFDAGVDQGIVVMASGLDRLYPSGNKQLLERVAERGLLISEYWPGVPPTRWRFIQRSRLVAALSHAVAIVEAGRRSGSLAVVAEAQHLKIPVGAFPGPITSAASVGTNRFIRDGEARLLTSSGDVLELLRA